MSFYERGPVRIRFEETGSGFPLLLIAGGGLNSTISRLTPGPRGAPFNPIEEFKITDHKLATYVIAFSPDGKQVASGGVDRSVYLWDSATWEVTKKLQTSPEQITAIAYSPDGKLLMTGGSSDFDPGVTPATIIFWDPESGKLIKRIEGQKRTTSVAFAPDGKTAASAHRDKTINLWPVP